MNEQKQLYNSEAVCIEILFLMDEISKITKTFTLTSDQDGILSLIYSLEDVPGIYTRDTDLRFTDLEGLEEVLQEVKEEVEKKLVSGE